MIFKVTDFDFNILKLTQESVADQANKILNKLIESSPVAYGSTKRPLDGWNEKEYESSTHRARLMFIEEIKREPCIHEPVIHDSSNFKCVEYKCHKCGVELQATWSEVKK